MQWQIMQASLRRRWSSLGAQAMLAGQSHLSRVSVHTGFRNSNTASPSYPGHLDRPIKTAIEVAIMNFGATISAVHPSTLLECGISANKVGLWDFNPMEVTVSTRWTLSGLVGPQIRQVGQLLSHQLAVIHDLACPILLGADFMIPADVHMHPATGRVWLRTVCLLQS